MRRRLVWVVYSSTMREEGRYLYYERAQAEEKLEQLLSKGKRKYFIQPIKEALNPDGTPVVSVGNPQPDDDIEEDIPVVVKDEDGVEDIDIDVELAGDEEEDAELAGDEPAEADAPE